MKKSRRISLFLVVMVALLMFGMSASAATKAKKIKLNKKKLAISVGEKSTLKATVKPKKANKKVKWKSSNKKIATVNSKGVVTGKKEGKVTITCISKNNPKVKATCKVTVKKAEEKSGSDNPSTPGTTTTSSTPTTPTTPTIKQTDGEELEKAKTIMGLLGEPLYKRFKGLKVTSQYNGDGSKKWTVGTTANGVTKNIRVYDHVNFLAYTFCDKWGGPNMTYKNDDIQIDNSALKAGNYNFASDPNGILFGWGLWNASTTKEEFEKMINGTLSDEVFQLVKDTYSSSYYFSVSGGGSTIVLYGKNTKGELVGKFAGVVSYNMSQGSVYFRVKGINPENTEYYGKNYYENIPWA